MNVKYLNHKMRHSTYYLTYQLRGLLIYCERANFSFRSSGESSCFIIFKRSSNRTQGCLASGYCEAILLGKKEPGRKGKTRERYVFNPILTPAGNPNIRGISPNFRRSFRIPPIISSAKVSMSFCCVNEQYFGTLRTPTLRRSCIPELDPATSTG